MNDTNVLQIDRHNIIIYGKVFSYEYSITSYVEYNEYVIVVVNPEYKDVLNVDDKNDENVMVYNRDSSLEWAFNRFSTPGTNAVQGDCNILIKATVSDDDLFVTSFSGAVYKVDIRNKILAYDSWSRG